MKERTRAIKLAEMILVELESLKDAQDDHVDNILALVNEILKDAKGLAEETLKDQGDTITKNK